MGALGLGVAATLYVLSSESGSKSGSEPEGRSTEGFRIAPVASPAGGGVLVRRRF